MFTRQAFLVRAGLVTAAAGTGLSTLPGKALATAPPPGYGVGQTAPAFTGVDQYLRQWNSSQFHGWTLLDFTASWCPPCNLMQGEINQFKQYLAGYGDTLNVVDILLQNGAADTAQRSDAELWANRYANERGVVLHPNGAYPDPLWELFDTYDTTDFPGIGDSFPTLVLLDKKHVIRLVVQGDWTSFDPDNPDTLSIAGQVAQAIGPSIPDPTLTPTSPVAGPNPYTQLDGLVNNWLPTSGLNAARTATVTRLVANAEKALRARTFSVAAGYVQVLMSKLTVWHVDPSVTDPLSTVEQFLLSLGTP